MSGFVLTYLPRQLSSPETHADGDVEAVYILVALVALWHRDVDGDGQEDGDIHCNDRPGPTTTQTDTGTQCGRDWTLKKGSAIENNTAASHRMIQSLTSAAPHYLP